MPYLGKQLQERSSKKGGRNHLYRALTTNAHSLSRSLLAPASSSSKVMQLSSGITAERINLIIPVRRRIHMIWAQMVPSTSSSIHKINSSLNAVPTHQGLSVLVRNHREQIAFHNDRKQMRGKANQDIQMEPDSPTLTV